MSDADTTMRAVALDAALAELQQWGVDRFSIEGVAHRSGLDPEYFLQTWDTKGDLLIAAMLGYNETMATAPDTGTLHGDLTELALSLGAYLNEPVGRRIARMLVVDSKSHTVDHESRSAFWSLRRDVIEAIFRRAAQRGEVRADVKPAVALQLLTAPLHTSALYTDLDITPGYCRAVADLVLRAVHAGA